jgi:hypothetical protein
MARLGRAEPVMSASPEKPAKFLAPPLPPKTVQTNNIDVAMTNTSIMR